MLSPNISTALHLSSLKQDFVDGFFEQKQKIQKEQTLKTLLQNALFLREDEERKRRWMNLVSDLSINQIDQFVETVIRENLRYKRHERNLVVELNKRSAQMSFA
ncbi:MAG: hypothetical protein WCJ84_03775 [Candidatus Peregrinibacteria bacterium]